MGISSRSDRKRYFALKASGVCVTCGYERASEGKTRCKKCIDAKKKSDAVRWEKLKTEFEDRCSHCLRNKPSPGMKTCASCRILVTAATRKRTEKAAKVRESQEGAS